MRRQGLLEKGEKGGKHPLQTIFDGNLTPCPSRKKGLNDSNWTRTHNHLVRK